MSSTPIADLSYRNYDGPIEPPSRRWWAIAKMSIELTLKKKGFWIWSVLSAWWYVALLFVFYFADRMTGQFQGGLGGDTANMSPEQLTNAMMSTVQWANPFVHAFSYAQLFFFVLALLTAVGTIANDNRANALLVYLS